MQYFHNRTNMFYRAALLSIAAFLSFVSCAKHDFHKEIAEGQNLYIIKSFTGNTKLEEMKPYIATLSMSSFGDNLCALTFTYDFTERPDQPKTPISLVIKEIPVTNENNTYSLSGDGLKGQWSFGAEYKDISVNGHIDYTGQSQMEISGKVGPSDFIISIRETSTEYPGSLVDVLADIDFLDYSEIAFTNSSGSSCTIRLKGGTVNQKLVLGNGETGVIGFYSNDIYQDRIDMSFADERTSSLNCLEAVCTPDGNQLGCLKKIGTEKDWYIRSVDLVGYFEPVRFERNLFEILP